MSCVEVVWSPLTTGSCAQLPPRRIPSSTATAPVSPHHLTLPHLGGVPLSSLPCPDVCPHCLGARATTPATPHRLGSHRRSRHGRRTTCGDRGSMHVTRAARAQTAQAVLAPGPGRSRKAMGQIRPTRASIEHTDSMLVFMGPVSLVLCYQQVLGLSALL
jgi:hypothetical protein